MTLMTVTRPDHPDAGDLADPGGVEATEEAPRASRGDLVGLAIQLDTMAARAEELGLGMTAYLLGVARADLGERLGERRRARERDPDDQSG